MDRFFKFSEKGSDFKTELLAGLTTFLTMAYILAVNPSILKVTGMDAGAVFTATAISACIGTLVMALIANLPFATAPGMGLNAFFAFTVVLGMGKSWQFALTAVFLEGIIFILLTMFNIREAIINCIPMNIKKAISVGIGLFIAFIGFQNSGWIVDNSATLVSLGKLGSGSVIVVLTGLTTIAILQFFQIKGALLIGILASTLIGIPLDVTNIQNFSFFSAPAPLTPILFKFEWQNIFTFEMFIVLFTFLLVDLFDTVGTLVGVTTKAGMLTKDGKVPRAKQALLSDAIGTTAGACLGTSTVTTYVESAAGVEEGGRTGLTALTTAILFFIAIFFSPLFLVIPAAATAPALIMVGLYMMSPIKDINFNDITESLPAFLTIMMMPLTYSISQGIEFGILSYVALKIATKQAKSISIMTYIVAAIFIAKIIFSAGS